MSIPTNSRVTILGTFYKWYLIQFSFGEGFRFVKLTIIIFIDTMDLRFLVTE